MNSPKIERHESDTDENRVGISLQHSTRLHMSTEMSMNAKKFAEGLPPAPTNDSDELSRTKHASGGGSSGGGTINAIRNMTFLGRSRNGEAESADNKGGISAMRNLTFFGKGKASQGEDPDKGGISAIRNLTFFGKTQEPGPDTSETHGISAIRNMTFLLGKPGEQHNTTKARRSMSVGYAPASSRQNDGNKKIIVGRYLTTRKLVMKDVDEIDHEVHRVLDSQITAAAKQFLDGECEGDKTTSPPEDVIVCHSRMSSSYIGTDSLFPLSTIPVAEGVQFSLEFEAFHDPEHITDGSNSCIYIARNKGVLNARQGQKAPESVVIKILNEEIDEMHTAKREFDFERDILAAISCKSSHPNIIEFLGSGRHGDIPFLVVERLDGGSLTYLLNKPRNSFSKDHPFSVITALEIIKSLANAVKYLHDEFHTDAVLIHRDIKPDNICFTASGALKLMDFGISTCVRRHVLARGPYAMTGMSGSLRYMAPEVANYDPYDESVDVYSFGILMYQVLTGETPFYGFKREKFMLDVVQNNHRPDTSLVVDLAYDERCCRETADSMVDILVRCWDPNRTNRPKMADVYEELVTLHTNEVVMKAASGCCA